MLERARRDHYAVPSVDFVDADTLKVVSGDGGGEPALSPSFWRLPGPSEPPDRSGGGAALAKYYREKASVPVVLHLDHRGGHRNSAKALGWAYVRHARRVHGPI